jgi:phosphate-starvation-inducible protein E
MSRKFVIWDSSATPAATIAALAAVTLVLGAVYGLLKDQGAPV